MVLKHLKKSIPILLAALFLAFGTAGNAHAEENLFVGPNEWKSYTDPLTGWDIGATIPSNPREIKISCEEAYMENLKTLAPQFAADIAAEKARQEEFISGGSLLKGWLFDDSERTRRRSLKNNESCEIPKRFCEFKENCYSCLVVRTLITTFMTIAPQLGTTLISAAKIVLVLGTMLTMLLTVFKYMSSLVQVEPMEEVKILLGILFKSAVAYFFIIEGVTTLVNFIVNPILLIGTDYGLAILGSVADLLGLPPPANEKELFGLVNINPIVTSNNIDGRAINKIVVLNSAIDYFTSTNMGLGNALMCHATNAGKISLFADWSLPDIWIWLVGICIWAFGFAMTLGVSFYLLDISFKLGLAIILLPLGIAFWPFSATKEKLIAVVGMILKSAAMFAFLSITVSYGLVLISKALGDMNKLIFLLDKGLSQNISDIFSVSGPHFLLIVFAYIYAMNLVEVTESAYVDKFFSDGVTGSASPMHAAATKGVGKATNMAKMGGKKAAKAAGAAASGAANKVKGWAKDSPEEGGDKPGGEQPGEGNSGGGNSEGEGNA